MLKSLIRQLFAARPAPDAAAGPDPGAVSQTLRRALADEAAGRHAEAESLYRDILTRYPGQSDAQHLLGRLLTRQGRYEEAVGALREVVAARPEAAEPRFSLGQALRGQGQFPEAAELFGAATGLDPQLSAAWIAHGDCLAQLERLDAAEEAYQQALRCAPGLAAIHHNYGNLLHRAGRIDEAIAAYRRAIELEPGFARAHSNLLYALNFSPAWTPEAIYAEHLAWARRHAVPLAGEARPHPNSSEPERRLRVGYVSPNFRDHAATYFFEPTLRHHDRARFSIHLYSDTCEPDSRTARLRGYGDEWCDSSGDTDEALAERVRRDRIDILVDLTGHTDGHRLLAFARKPAPVQVTWNGYANTTGMDTMDYRLSDRHADPEGATERWHSERLVRLPEIYMAFEPPEEAPPVNPSPLGKRGHVTFGSFNAFAKITPQVIATWARILLAVPDARLMMLTVPEGRARRALVSAFAGHGIPEARLQLAGRMPFVQFLTAHLDIDIALDPFPFAGTTTTCHSLWMGVPVVTLAGRVHAGRTGVSFLENVGLGELVARNEGHYVDLAAALANDAARLRELRAGLRARTSSSPITDGARLTRALEGAYRTMWEDYCRSRAGGARHAPDNESLQS